MGLGGVELTQIVRRTPGYSPQALPILAISADTTDETQGAMLRAGASAFMAKPYSQDELYAMLVSLLEQPKPDPLRAPTVTQGTSKAIDWDQFAELHNHNRSFMRTLAHVFLEQRQQFAQKLRTVLAATSPSVAVLTDLLHQLSASLGYVGAGALAQRVRELEGRLRTAPSAEPVVAELESILGPLEVIRAELQQFSAEVAV